VEAEQGKQKAKEEKQLSKPKGVVQQTPVEVNKCNLDKCDTRRFYLDNLDSG